MEAFFDAYCAGDSFDRRSRSVFLVKLVNASSVWGSKKHNTVSLSTCETEYYEMTISAQ